MITEPPAPPVIFACQQCRFEIGSLELMRVHMVARHGAQTNWPAPALLSLTDAEARELHAFLLHAYLNASWPRLRGLITRLDEHLDPREAQELVRA